MRQSLEQVNPETGETIMTGWSAGDLAFGLRALLKAKNKSRAEGGKWALKPPATSPLTFKKERVLIQRLMKWCQWSDAAYCSNSAKAAAKVGIAPKDIIASHWTSDHMRPAYFVGLDHASKTVAVCVRGTASLRDALTDLTLTIVPFMGSLAHLGMVQSATALHKAVKPELAQALESNKGYTVVVVGHSLGGGTAALLTMLMAEDDDTKAKLKNKLQGVCFAPPSVVALDLSVSPRFKPLITSVCMNYDLVPRLTMQSLDGLRKEVTAYSWEQEMMDAAQRTRIGVMVMALAKTKLVAQAREAGSAVKEAGKAVLGSMGAALQQKLAKAGEARKGADGGSSTSSAGGMLAISLVQQAHAHLSTRQLPVKAEESETKAKGLATMMYPPGRLLIIYKSSTVFDGAARMFWVEPQEFSEVQLSGKMVAHHKLDTYSACLAEISVAGVS
jgi:alpha-beta hydrolase superfamily lysophospholipase